MRDGTDGTEAARFRAGARETAWRHLEEEFGFLDTDEVLAAVGVVPSWGSKYVEEAHAPTARWRGARMQPMIVTERQQKRMFDSISSHLEKDDIVYTARSDDPDLDEDE